MANESEHQPEVRVILVGRTGLDASLRLDPGVELLRVRTALEAIGELSDPIDDVSPAGAVIVVGPDAEPGPQANGHGVGRAEFLKAVRLVDPKARVLRAMERGAAATLDDLAARGYDGVIDPDFSAQVVSSLIRGVEGPGAPKPGATASENGRPVQPSGPARAEIDVPPPPPLSVPVSPAHRSSSPRPSQATGPAKEKAPSHPVIPGVAVTSSPAAVPPLIPAAQVAAFGDGAMVRVLLRGGELSGPAIELLRIRTSDEGVRFIAPGQPLPEGVAPVPVTCDGHAYGHLWSERTIPEELRLHAEWLALWLRLGEQQAQLREAAFTDPLTGAWNRRYFDRYLSAAIQRARIARQPVTVMCFDIDDFKRFNDTYGHGAADEILVETVRLLRSVIRPSDRVCRVGGDEFAVIFHEPSGPRKAGSAPPASVFDIATRFQQQISERRFPKLGVDAPGTLTVSGGLATFPWDGTTPEELIRHADLLAMESKRAGKNAIVIGPGRTSTGTAPSGTAPPGTLQR